ncbi:mapk-regulated corepressor-interacting protein 1 isoform X1 [Mirounga leonina]|uniref:mapk-regulated corepressor-interacting protein 1 isoform X1 n=1 Tax=Mirounga leonina TaxID=9715 RepID=UPI00156C5510|nr:mapk-regulated corepressor-interacting protein 1 isoform X1 [Mirounga leonina]
MGPASGSWLTGLQDLIPPTGAAAVGGGQGATKECRADGVEAVCVCVCARAVSNYKNNLGCGKAQGVWRCTHPVLGPAPGIWLCVGKESETGGLTAGLRVLPCPASPQEVLEGPRFPCKSKRPRGPASGAQGPDTPAMTSSPVSRVVYNGKRNSSPRSPPSSSEIFTPAHEENVRFIYEAWQGVERDLRSQMSGSERGLVEEYVEKVPNPSLKTFKPIDLSDLKRRNTPDAKKS